MSAWWRSLWSNAPTNFSSQPSTTRFRSTVRTRLTARAQERVVQNLINERGAVDRKDQVLARLRVVGVAPPTTD